MATLTTTTGRRLVLDSGGVIALADGNTVARAAVDRARREGWLVVIPTPVLVEVHTGGHDRARIDRVVKAVDMLIPTLPEIARDAGLLRARSRVLDVVDAVVVAEAVAAVPAVILTADPDDVGALLDAAGVTEAQVRVVAV